MAANKTKTVLKSLRVLEELSGTSRGLTNKEVADRLDLTPSTCHRLLNTLTDQGYISKEGSSYRLGPKIFQLKSLAYKQEKIKRQISPFLIDLEEKFGYTINLAVRWGVKVIPIDIIQGSKNLVVNKNLGIPAPLHASALGKCMLAFSDTEVQEVLLSHITLSSLTQNTITQKNKLLEELENIKKKGHAVDNEEYAEGVICIAVPILNETNFNDFTVSVSGPATELNKQRIDAVVTGLEEMKECFSRKYFGELNADKLSAKRY